MRMRLLLACLQLASLHQRGSSCPYIAFISMDINQLKDSVRSWRSERCQPHVSLGSRFNQMLRKKPKGQAFCASCMLLRGDSRAATRLAATREQSWSSPPPSADRLVMPDPANPEPVSQVAASSTRQVLQPCELWSFGGPHRFR